MTAPRDESQSWPRRIAILGAAGAVGSSLAAQLALNSVGSELFLIDIRENLVESHVIDLSDAQAVAELPASPRIIAGAPQDGPVDVVIVAASRPETPNGDRRDFLAGNAELLELLKPQIETLAGDHGIVLLLSNPVDILATWFVRTSSVPAERVLGYSLNDSARFRLAIARELGVSRERVGGEVYGEHGNGQVPMFSSITLDGAPFTLTEDQARRVLEDVDQWFVRWSALNAGRSSTWSTGIGVRQLLHQIGSGHTVVTTTSTHTLADFPDVFIALETRLEQGRIQTQPPLGRDEEIQALLAAATRVEDAALDLL